MLEILENVLGVFKINHNYITNLLTIVHKIVSKATNNT